LELEQLDHAREMRRREVESLRRQRERLLRQRRPFDRRLGAGAIFGPDERWKLESLDREITKLDNHILDLEVTS